MQLKGLSAQKNVHSCTIFCAYVDRGMRIKDQGSGDRDRVSPVKQIQTGFTPMEYKIQMHSIGHAGWTSLRPAPINKHPALSNQFPEFLDRSGLIVYAYFWIYLHILHKSHSRPGRSSPIRLILLHRAVNRSNLFTVVELIQCSGFNLLEEKLKL